MQNHQKSFTLIELLVVIAIFGLLASVVVMSVKSTRERARIANLLTYSATIKKVLGADIVGEWRFEEGTGDIVADISGYGNHGVFSGGQWVKNDIHELGWAGTNFGNTVGLEIDDSDSLRIQNEITLEAWIKLNSLGTTQAIISKGSQGYIFGIVSSDSPIFFLGIGNLNRKSLTCGKKPFVVNRWHHVVATYDGSKMRIIIDAEICGETTHSGKIYTTDDDLYIGTFMGLTRAPLQGTIDEVKVYERGLTMAEIQQHYVEGAAKRGIAANF